jgi:hypothetical protein
MAKEPQDILLSISREPLLMDLQEPVKPQRPRILWLKLLADLRK